MKFAIFSLCVAASACITPTLCGATAAEADNNQPERDVVGGRFAPWWLTVSKFPADPPVETTSSSASYSIVWQPRWQAELELSPEQKTSLADLKAKADAESLAHAEQFKSLPQEEQQAQMKSWGGQPAPWRQQLDREVRTQIETVLTPRQLQVIREFSAPRYIVGLLYDANVRKQIGLSVDQEERLKAVIRERLSRLQEEHIQVAEAAWNRLSVEQQALMPAVVKRQGPTSAVLSLAYDNGFDLGAMGLVQPMLAQAPVQKRLKLTEEQEQKLQAMIQAARTRAEQVLAGTTAPQQSAGDQAQLSAILTPQQLVLLEQINFRRQVVLALTYPEKRQSIGLSNAEWAEMSPYGPANHERLYHIDVEMIGKAIDVLTPAQHEQMKAEVERRFGG